MDNVKFSISPTIKAIVGIGTFVIAGLMAREASREGIELFEEKVNDQIDKRINKHQTTPPAPAE